MSKLLSDGMDMYNVVADLSQRYSTTGSARVYGSTIGRFGGGGIRFDNGSSSIIALVTGNPQTAVVSFAIFRSNTVPTANQDLFRFENASASGLISLESNASDVVDVMRGATILGTFTLTKNAWHWLSIKVKASNTVGTVDISVDDVSVFTFSGDTVDAGAEEVHKAQFIGNTVQDITFDDIIITDVADPSPFNDILSDSRIDTRTPNAAGDSTQYTGSPSANFTNAQTNDGDTSTNVNATSGNKDLYNFDSMGFTPVNISAVDVVACVKNPTPGTEAVKLKIKEGTTEGTGSNITLTSSYAYHQATFPLNPDTGTVWTEAEVNGVQAGMETV